MKCNRIQVSNFRNIEKADVRFSEGINILKGANAQGKTNLLEAIFYVALGKSFRTSHDEDLIRFGSELCEVSLDFEDSLREQNITVRLMEGKRRRFEHNHIRLAKVSEIVGLFRTVLFCPEHLSLVKEGPAERRGFLDVAVSQLYPNYLRSLQTYNQILKQRNRLIRDAEQNRNLFSDTIEMWSVQLAHESAVLSKYRNQYIKKLQVSVRDCFREMTGGSEIPDFTYEPSLHIEGDVCEDEKKTERLYIEKLMTNHDREIAAGSTLWGAHKDDIGINLNEKPARLFASQGQQRSIALAMKLAEGEICREICGEIPAFLLDDVFSELDATRREYLSEKIQGKQVLITTCEPLPDTGRQILVKNGTYTEE